MNSETFAIARERPRLDRRQSAASNGRSLLIVDDELSIGKALTRLLRRDGYHILVAGSGEQALEMLAMHRVQVIISDQRMPGMSGTELLDKVKILYPDTIRMVLSGYTDLNVITESVNRGAVFRFLTKPWDDDNLRAQVRDAFLHHDGQNSTP
ncbi:MAG: response regulator [Lysobacterales bacterium]